ncbi:CBO0543 family protein [Litchfieldia salsa]|uniref:CBO0543 family protein n=1 Tax=Litchfieldia salsa TaxID=930152 RepID=UPI000B879414|nr:CBO0543 family protein [Litchfieldia salsa]
MDSKQQQYFDKLTSIQENLTKETVEYWKVYSDFSTWQFWFILIMLVGPLILLFFTIDRKMIFRIGFFGFSVHILFAYIESFGIRYGFWGYPYQVLPFLPSFSLDASVIPIVSMLVYQWTINHNKSFFLYSVITAIIFGFGFKPLLVSINLFQKDDWVNYFLIFLLYLILFQLAYLMTKLFLVLHKKGENNQ